VVRWTARTSLFAFALAYAARPAHQLWRSSVTKQLLAERKWIGLSFAVSHLFHLGGIVALASPDFGAFLRNQPPTNLIAALTFLLIFAMAITSIEAIKARMSATAWKRLHRTGMHFAWISFAGTYTTAIGVQPLYAIPAALVLGLGAIRLAAWLRLRARSSRSPARPA
jgi:DMSO/TMAO reductase YedYZ heme-binding membrane subunit